MDILVPMDFSPFSEFALKMAIKISKKTGSRIYLFHAIENLSDLTKLKLAASQSKDLQEHLVLWTKEKLERIQRDVKNRDIDCEIIYSKGRFLRDLIDLVEEKDFDLVVMGSHGVSGKEEWFLGSNTAKTVRRIHTNVLVVKNDVEKYDFSDVVFVTGLNESEQIAFKRFLQFIEMFDVKQVHIMAVDTSSYFTQPTILMKEALEDFKSIASSYKNIQTHFYQDYSIEAGIRHFSREYNIDLVGMSNHKRHPIKRIFLGSNVEMVVNHSDVPVLTIDFKE